MSGERINFAMACVPNWVDEASTVLTAGGEALELGILNLKDQLMGKPWRTPGLKPRFTQFTAFYGDPEKRLSRSLLLGAINLPEKNTMLRIRKGESVADEWIRPLYRTNGGGNTLIAASNTTGGIAALDDDPYSPNSSYVEPTSTAAALDFRVPLRPPANPLAAGDLLQAVQVAYTNHGTLAAGPTITVQIYQGGVSTGLTITETAFPAGETDHWVVELKFDAADLPDSSGAGLEVRVLTTPIPTCNLKVAAVRLLATTGKRTARPALGVAWLEATNANAATPASIAVVDVFDRWAVPAPGAAPTSNSLPMVLRAGFDDPGTLSSTVGVQGFAVQYSPTAGTTGQIAATLYVNGVSTGITTSASAAGGAVPHWLVLPFSSADLGGGTPADVEIRIVTTPSGTNNVRVDGAQWIASLTASPYDLDTGWIEAFPPPPSSEWGVYVPDDVGKPVIKTIPMVFLDEYGEPVTYTSAYTRVEFLLSPAGPWSFADPYNPDYTVTWFDMCRFAEGPALSGMNMGSGFEIDTVDRSTRDESDGGVMWDDDEQVYRTVTVRLNNLEKELAVSDLYDYVIRRLGISRDVLLMVFPADQDFRRAAFAWGPLQKTGKLTHDQGTRFRGDFSVRERI